MLSTRFFTLPVLQALLMAMEAEDSQPFQKLLAHLVDAGELTTSQTSKVGVLPTTACQCNEEPELKQVNEQTKETSIL